MSRNEIPVFINQAICLRQMALPGFNLVKSLIFINGDRVGKLRKTKRKEKREKKRKTEQLSDFNERKEAITSGIYGNQAACSLL